MISVRDTLSCKLTGWQDFARISKYDPSLGRPLIIPILETYELSTFGNCFRTEAPLVLVRHFDT